MPKVYIKRNFQNLTKNEIVLRPKHGWGGGGGGSQGIFWGG